MRIVNAQQVIIPPSLSDRPQTLFARRITDIVVRAPRVSAPDDATASKQGRGRFVDIEV